MVNPNDSIRFRNVISKRYKLYNKDIAEVMEAFLTEVSKININIKGPLFYSINDVPNNDIMEMEFFISIKEDKAEVYDDMDFHSYFSIENMISESIFEDFEKNTEITYAILNKYLKQNKLIQVTPIFHVISGDQTLQYALIKIGVSENEN